MTTQSGHIKNSSEISATFARIARCYDFNNHLLSCGMDIWWRKKAAQSITIHKPSVLDVCCGTGDMALAIGQSPCEPINVTGCDFVPEMLKIAQKKSSHHKQTAFTWQQADTTALPFADNSFDVVTCAFGLRNIPNLGAAISEIYRVLKPGGQVCILEFSLPKRRFSRTIYLLYFRRILPWIAAAICGNFKAYRHLSESVCYWERQIDLQQDLQKAELRDIELVTMTLGIVQLFTGYK